MADDGLADPKSVEREALEAAWKIHAAVTDWTGKVDAKASFALTIESAAVVAVITLTTQGRIFSQLALLSRLALWIAAVLLVIAAGLAVMVVIPRLRTAKIDTEWHSNFIYFGHLRHWNADDLAKAITGREILPVLARQIINMSKIVWIKHRLVQASLRLAVLATVILLYLVTFAT